MYNYIILYITLRTKNLIIVYKYINKKNNVTKVIRKNTSQRI